MDESIHYERIAKAIEYIRENFKTQPKLEDIAERMNLSPFHFQRMFEEWAGVSPKKFLQFISIEHAKKMLRNEQATLFDVAMDTGLSGTGRLHDLFVSIEGMTPGEYKNGGQNLLINYSFADSPFGKILVASTPKGVCYLTFVNDDGLAVQLLKNDFPNASFSQKTDLHQENAISIFDKDWSGHHQIKLHLKGTEFQIKVWEALLKIPVGELSSYGDIAKKIHCPNACRAVGTAVGDNPIAFIIPCHRVIRSGGEFGNYRWGSTRKTAIIGWEGSRKY